MHQTVSWKVLLGIGVMSAAILYFIGAGGTLGYMLWGASGLLVLLGIIGYFQK